MRYVTATIGAILIVLGVFFLCTLANRSFYMILMMGTEVGLVELAAYNWLGIIFSLLAAWASFAATLRHYRKRKVPVDPAQRLSIYKSERPDMKTLADVPV